MKRQASIERSTRETKIKASVDLDGAGTYDVATGIGFLDHMLEQLSRHSLIDITLKADGDLQIFMANLRYFKEALAKLRPGRAA